MILGLLLAGAACAAAAQQPAQADEAERLGRVAALEAEGPASFPAYLNAAVELSTYYTNQARYAEALPILRRAAEASQRTLGPQHAMSEQLRVTVLLMERFVADRQPPQAAAPAD
jgi:hypothetical protein